MTHLVIKETSVHRDISGYGQGVLTHLNLVIMFVCLVYRMSIPVGSARTFPMQECTSAPVLGT